MIATIGRGTTPPPTDFDWLSGVWIPVIVGSASIVVAFVALIVALAANRTAGAALSVSRDAAQREARMPRERVVHAAIMSMNAAMNSAWAENEDFELRVIPTLNKLVQGAGDEGVDQSSVQPLTRWLVRETGAVAAATTSNPQRFHELPSQRMGMLALRMSFGLRIDEWVKTEQVMEAATVAQEQSDLMKATAAP